jgi:uncharacterized membrane protein YhaH (DUF805 family)
MAFASLLLLMGLGTWERDALIAGVAIAVAVFAASAYLALRRWRDRPRPAGFGWMMGALAAYYVIAAIVAAIAGAKYTIVALLAALIPFSALFLLLATTRAKTPSPVSSDDPYPGIGADDETPFGSTREHSDAEA